MQLLCKEAHREILETGSDVQLPGQSGRSGWPLGKATMAMTRR